MATREPESCICPTCRRVMRLSRVHALRAFDTIEFYLRCDAYDYTSGQLTGIPPGEFACDVHPAARCQPEPSDLIARCEREVATLVGASGKKSADQSPRTARLARLRSLDPGDDCASTGTPALT
jgi:hypothetical protein